MRRCRRQDLARLAGQAGAGLFALALVLAASAVLAADPKAAAGGAADYRSFYGGNSRNVVWIVAQIHLMFGAFVLGVPIFASIVEIIGWRTGEARYDRLAASSSSGSVRFPNDHEHSTEHACLSRRAFLLSGGSAVTVTLLEGPLSLVLLGQGAALKRASYPRKKIARLSQLKVDQPVAFQYPWTDFNSTNMLVKLGTRAGAGVGPDRDIVAFSTLCSHMGGPLAGQYRGRYKVLGPCPLHLTTFDLTRYGMVVAGQATESLPQISLEISGGDIWATGVQGLIYGYHANLAGA